MTRLATWTRTARLAAPHLWRILLALLALILVYLLYAGAQTYRHATSLRAHASTLKNNALSNPGIVGDELRAVRGDVARLRRDLGPLLWAARGLGWVPWVGPTVRAGPDLVEAGALYLDVGIAAWEAAGEPLAQGMADDRGLQEVAPAVIRGIAAHRAELDAAVEQARRAADLIAGIDAKRLLPPLGEPLARVQGILPLATAGLEALPLLPSVAPAEGTRTYLLLAQNNDELRATGGFISSIGTLSFVDGVPALGPMQDSYAVEDWTKAHPDPPEALREHMGIDLWTTRDGNWSPDFPTSARDVAALYELNQGTEVHGVIAVDMAAAIRLLEVLTPLTLPGGATVEPGQVMETFRQSWSLPEDALITPGVVVTATQDFEAIEVELLYSRQTGRAWFDAVEVVALDGPERNLVANPSFEEGDGDALPTGWEGMNLSAEDGCLSGEAHEGERSFHIVGDVAVDKTLRQRIAHAGGAKEVFRVRALSRTENTDYRAGPYALAVRFVAGGDAVQERTLRFPDLAYHWATAGSTDIQADWLKERKAITQELVTAGAARLAGGAAHVPWLGLAEEVARLLAERHVQIYAAEPGVQTLLARVGWDGAMGVADGDYLAVVDSNVGYNKVTVSLEQAVRYEVEVGPEGAARSRLTIRYRNASTRAVGVCDKYRSYIPSYDLLAQGCYWGHLRVYVPDGAVLEDATGSDDGVEVRREAGLTVFSASLFLEPGDERELRFTYTLVDAGVTDGAYALMVRKQAGTDAIPLEVEILAPDQIVGGEPEDLSVRANRATLDTDLTMDRRVDVRWR